MKRISIVIPTYNEEENVVAMSDAIIDQFKKNLPQYDYEIIFIDNDSKDNTRNMIEGLCLVNKKIKAIFNAKNFGQNNSPYYGLCQATGDCAILIAADFQEPPEMIPEFVKGWEEGYQIVCGIKTSSKESKIMYFLRTCYYKLIRKMSSIELFEHFTGLGLYDKSFLDTLRKIDDPAPFLRGVVAELGGHRKEVPYQQQKRKNGKTNNNWYLLYDIAMLSFTSYTKIGMRFATIFGFLFSAIGFVVALAYLLLKIIFWNSFSAGTTPILIGVFLFGSVQLFFIGLLGEYIMNINTRVMNRPLVIEAKRINFDDNK